MDLPSIPLSVVLFSSHIIGLTVDLLFMGGLRAIECYNKVYKAAEFDTRELSKNEFKIQMAIKTGWALIPNIPPPNPPPIDYHRVPPRRTEEEARAVAALLRYLQDPHDYLMGCPANQPRKRKIVPTAKQSQVLRVAPPTAFEPIIQRTTSVVQNDRIVSTTGDEQGPSQKKPRNA